MKKTLLLTAFAALFALCTVHAQNVFDPNDPIVTYDPAHPPAIPPMNTISKWVRTVRLPWNTDKFKPYYFNDMAMRIRYPNGYNPADHTKKYPVILFFHGGGEVADVTDNEYQLNVGAQEFEQRINNGEFNGFMVFAQVRSGGAWDYSYYTKVSNILDSLNKYCNLDLDRVISMGLSNGGLGAINYSINYPQKSAVIISSSPALIQVATPNINNIIHIPTWVATGGKDVNPAPSVVQEFVDTFTNRGGSIIYDYFAAYAHYSWETQWAEPQLVPFWNTAHKANPLVFFNRTKFKSNASFKVKMGITGGFAQYEWSKDNVIIGGATSNEMTVSQFGTYRVHFKRTYQSDWSDWSPIPVVISSDDIAPSTPVNMKVDYSGRTFITLDWDNAVDNDSVATYDVYINGQKNYTTQGSAFTVDNLLPNTSYTFNVVATDRAGNNSGVSSQFTASTTTGNAGLNYRYVEGEWNFLPNFNALTPVAIGTSPNIDITKRKQDDHFGFVWEGYINIPAAGDYTFETVSDDGSKLYFNSFYSPSATPLINNDGIHAMSSTTGTVNVPAAGVYPIAITFFDKIEGQGLEVYWTGPGIGRQLIPNSAFFNYSTDNTPPSTPANVKVTATGGTYLDLNWDASTDDVGVSTYDVYVNDVKKLTTATNNISINSLSLNTSYKITVKALDQAGNASAFSTPVNATTGASPVTGLKYRYFEGSWNQLPDFNALTPVKTGVSPTVDISLRPSNVNDNFGFVWEGHINLPVAGNYTFETVSDDGSKLYFNTMYSASAVPLINNDGLHGPWSPVAGSVSVPAAGSYPFAVSYFEKDGGQSIEVYLTGPGIPRTLINASFFKETSVQPVASGLLYRYYEGNWDQLPDFNALTPVNKGITPNVDISLRNVNDYFGFVWEGNITIPTPGDYTFETVSDDGSKLYFNANYSSGAQALVNNDGLHGPWSPVAANINIPSAGSYPIAITFFEKNLGEAMQVYWTGPGIPRQLIPNSAFTYNQSDNSAPTVPLNVRVVGTGGTYADVTWDNSTDNLAVASYDVYVNDIKKATVIGTASTITNLNFGTTYKITVKAADQAGNSSDFSTPVYATTNASLVNGLRYRYYQGTWNVLPDFNALTPVKTGITPNIDISVRTPGVNDYFGFVWEGHINIPTAGAYTFEVVSDDGSKVYFNNFYSATAKELINNDGLHGAYYSVPATVNIPSAGSYPFAASFFEKDGGEAMQVYWTGPGIARQLIPNSAFMESTSGSTPSMLNATPIALEAAAVAAEARMTGVYPNPVKDKINIGLKNIAAGSNVEVSIYDLQGKLMLGHSFGNVQADISSLQLDVSGTKLNAGIYMMRMTVNGTPANVVKLVKTR